MKKSLSYALSSDTTLPRGWSWSTIGVIADVVAGNPAPQGDEYFRDGSHPFLRVQDMGRLGNNSHVYKTHDYINNKAIQSLRLFPKGSVLFTKSGASTLLNQRAILGRDMYVVSHIAATIPHEGILSEWLFYWLKTVDFNKLAHATTLPSLPLSKAKDIHIPVAPIRKQKLIVSEIEQQFSRLDEAVAALKRIKANLKRYKASVLKAAVEGKLTEEWRKNNKDVEPAEKLLKRILAERKKKWEEKNPGKKYKDPAPPDTSNLPDLPKWWVWASLDAICSVFSGEAFKKKDYSDTGIRLFQIANVSFGEVIWDQKNYLPKHFLQAYPELELKESDIVMALNRPILNNKLKIAQLGHQDVPAILYQRVAKFNFDDRSLTKYFFVFGQSPFFIKQVRDNLQGTDQPYLNTSLIPSMVMPLPPINEQKKIIEEVERRLSVAEEIETAVETNLKRAERLRQSILKKAFSGRLI